MSYEDLNFADKIMAEIKDYIGDKKKLILLTVLDDAINNMIRGTSWVDV